MPLQDEGDKLVIFERGDLVFVFNFHPTNSYSDYRVGCRNPGDYKVQGGCATPQQLPLRCWDAGPACMVPLADLHAVLWRPPQCSISTPAGCSLDQQARSEDARWCAEGQLHFTAVCLWQTAPLQAELALGLMTLDLCASSWLPPLLRVMQSLTV